MIAIKHRTLFWHIFPAFAAILLLTLLLTAVYASRTIKNFYLEQLHGHLESHAWHVSTLLPSPSRPANYAAINALCVTFGDQLSNRITVILPDGRVIGDSIEAPANMENHRTRPEIHQAFDGFVGMSQRYSRTLQQELLYVAVPLRRPDADDGPILAVVRASMPVDSINRTLSDIFRDLTAAGAIIGMIAIGTSWFIAHRISAPVETIRQGALRFANGELGHKIRLPKSDEIGILAHTMNQMAAQLSERIQTIIKQRNELEAVLENMVEAVIILDLDQRIMRCNKAAIQVFSLDPSDVGRRYLQEMIRNADIHRFVDNAFKHGDTTEDVLRLHHGQECFLHVHSTFLYDPHGDMYEMLLVFHDITRLKQLESMRREFVANVSHELRTPITSILGFIETLQDGALHEPENARKFLDIIQRNASRLNTIITDLLMLSRIEYGHERDQMAFTERKLSDIVESASLACEKRAQEQGVSLRVHCPEDLVMRVNADLLEQAIVNLLDNAIKYSEPGSDVRLTVSRQHGGVKIEVQDAGCGIAADHLPRLFERFYRVDKARSRKLGGTGLGLAIVKHIANVHGGRATVTSRPGHGSTFSLMLPRPFSEPEKT